MVYFKLLFIDTEELDEYYMFITKQIRIFCFNFKILFQYEATGFKNSAA
jgi:hypothetical protein